MGEFGTARNLVIAQSICAENGLIHNHRRLFYRDFQFLCGRVDLDLFATDIFTMTLIYQI